ncbi:hypothetical protein SAZ10_12340 [Mesorhizobium sp. BAC0120]|uniref:hypothetical protein n=1 Tax=Mesorhizobium sp. BAC0120 TaxID=3090670 RepID=UPI00298CD35C|nr:hypothetical protein [Mesorhizobium sp. BAC0120]MDW6022543.1 hypothetical protein [Mesorhizobium sp. BAC0120]
MITRREPDAAAFMQKWLAYNVAADSTPENLQQAVRSLTRSCLDSAARLGISAARIEFETGSLAADLIQKEISRRTTSRAKPAVISSRLLPR